jgi:SsrA-binding protein
MKTIKNKRAYFDFNILEEFDCGIMLEGGEVKSIRDGNVSMNDSFIFISNSEVYIKSFRVSKYSHAHPSVVHIEDRDKKLLLTKKQIEKIQKFLKDKGNTCVPLKVFIKSNKIKVKIGLGKGKKLYDKRKDLKEKDLKREISRNT